MCVWTLGCYTVPRPVGSQAELRARHQQRLTNYSKIDSLLEKDQFIEARELARVYGRPADQFQRSQLDLANEGAQILDAGPSTADTVLGRMTIQEDKVDNIRWYFAKVNTLRTNLEYDGIRERIHIYLGQRIDAPNTVWLRIVVRSHGSRWAFMREIKIVADGQRFDWDNVDFKRDYRTKSFGINSHVEVTEKVDWLASDKEHQMLKAVIHAKDAVMRLRGERFTCDYTFTDMDRLLFQDMLTLYDKLKASR